MARVEGGEAVGIGSYASHDKAAVNNMDGGITVSPEDRDAILRVGQQFHGHIYKCASDVSQETQDLFGEAMRLGVLAINAGFSQVEMLKFKGKFSDRDGRSQFLVYATAFVAGSQITRIAILQGFYIRAAALLRQEIEHASRIRLLREGKYEFKDSGAFRKKKVPHAKTLNENFDVLYGNLSDIAHLSSVEAIADFTTRTVPVPAGMGEGEMQVARIEPELVEYWASAMMEAHCVFCAHVLEDVAEFAETIGSKDAANRIWQSMALMQHYLLKHSEARKAKTATED